MGIGSSRVDPDAPLYLGNPTGISAYADQQTDIAHAYILQLGALTSDMAAPTIEPEFPTGGSAPAISIPAVPAYADIVWTSPNAPAAFTGELTIDDLLPDPFDTDAPTLNFASAPDAFAETLPSAPAVDLAFDEPTLSVDLPAAPDLLTISVQPFNGLNMPTFDAEEPVIDLVEPTLREYTPGDAYTSGLLTAMQTALQERIEQGGSGLHPDVENAIWDRGREREARSVRDGLAELERMERLGYSLPTGGYVSARLRITTEMDYANRGHSREVMIKAAELEQENVKHALTTAVSLEGQLINYTNATEQRLFESTRYATEAGVAIYNAKVQAYGAMVDVYRAKVQAYEALVRAETAKVDAYRAEIAAEEAKAQVNVALVEQYKAQADVALAGIRVYEAELNGIRIRADIEKLKVEVYGEQVRAYGSQVNAYTAGVEGYRAGIEAEGAKQRAFSAQVEAYVAQVRAANEAATARIEAYRGQISAKELEYSGYRATIEAETARVRSIADNNSSLSESYRAEVQGVSAYNETLTKQWQATLDQNQRTAEVAISAAKANAELYVTTRSLALDSAKVGAQVSSQLGAAAINAINWSSSISNSSSVGVSTSYSNSDSSSNSNSTSTSYNYNYSV